MFSRIRVMGMLELERYTPQDKTLVISILDRQLFISERSDVADRMGQIIVNPHENILIQAFFSFDDVESPGVTTTAMTEGQAEGISKLIMAHMDEVEEIVCQCTAGISRSAGLAAAISRHFFGADQYFFDHYIPNMHVYRTMLMALDRILPQEATV